MSNWRFYHFQSEGLRWAWHFRRSILFSSYEIMFQMCKSWLTSIRQVLYSVCMKVLPWASHVFSERSVLQPKDAARKLSSCSWTNSGAMGLPNTHWYSDNSRHTHEPNEPILAPLWYVPALYPTIKYFSDQNIGPTVQQITALISNNLNGSPGPLSLSLLLWSLHLSWWKFRLYVSLQVTQVWLYKKYNRK